MQKSRNGLRGGYPTDRLSLPLRKLHERHARFVRVDILTDEEIARFLAHPRTPSASNVRGRAIFLTLLDTGNRDFELSTLTTPHAHLDEGFTLMLGWGKEERQVKSDRRPPRRYGCVSRATAQHPYYRATPWRVPAPPRRRSAVPAVHLSRRYGTRLSTQH